VRKAISSWLLDGLHCGRPVQEDPQFKTILDFVVRACIKKRKKRKEGRKEGRKERKRKERKKEKRKILRTLL
jgi:hypothetical protein